MWWLLACACPSFDETHVVDASTVGDAPLLDELALAIDRFADWTGRGGVCVAEVEVVDAIGTDADAVNELGVFEGPPPHIQVVADATDPMETVTHELCHALDHHERISPAHADLFPGDALASLGPYNTPARRHAEAFALACEDGPVDDALSAAQADRCGGTAPTDVDRFLREVVYPDAPRAHVDDVPADLTLRPLLLASPELGAPDAVVTGLVADGDALLLLVRTPAVRNRWISTLTLVWFDPDTGAVEDRISLELPAATWSGALVPGDDGPLVIAWNDNHADPLGRTFTVRDHALVARALRVPDPWGGAGAVIDGTLVWASSERRDVAGNTRIFGIVRAAALDTGRERPLEFPGETWGLSVWATGFLLTDDGLEMSTDDGLARLDPTDGTWTLTHSPPQLSGLFRLGERRGFLWEADGVQRPIVYDPGADTWALPTDTCGGFTTQLPNLMAQVGKRPFLLRAMRPIAGHVMLDEIIGD